MKLLVAIASYGTRNDAYLHRLLQEYRQMPYEVKIVVVSNIPKDLGDDVEVLVGLPSSNPWSLPFAHKSVFVERAEQHDLFIYSEDDTLITPAHIEAFLWATDVLQPDEIAGFLRSEQGPDGTLYYSTIHNHYHWDVNSVRHRGGETFAYFTNEHGACYLLTRDHLRRAIASGGFAVAPHEGKYDLLVSAATDPYTQCGLTKVVCVSRLPEFTCSHLTNKYIGRTGIPAELVDLQVQALMRIAHDDDRAPVPTRVEPLLPGTRWIKSYYEPCRDDIVSLVPATAKSVLSIGCGWGSTEEALLRRHLAVSAVPLDVVIGEVATRRGIRVVRADLLTAPQVLAGETFDALIVSGLLHLVDDPVALLRAYRRLLAPRGVVIVAFPNLNHASVWWRRLAKAPEVEGIADHRRSGIHLTSLRRVKRWMQSAGFALSTARPNFGSRWARYHRATLGIAGRIWASDYTIVARPSLANAGSSAVETRRPSTAGATSADSGHL